MRQIIHEPLLHFLLIGVALFFVFDIFSEEQVSDNRRIIIHDGITEMLIQRHKKIWQRSPTASELEGLLNTYIREEILYREGLAMQLDRNDSVVRRRVLQKISVLTEEAGSQQAASEDELKSYLNLHHERYKQPAMIGFDQVMFDPVRHGNQLDTQLKNALSKLQAGTAHAQLGDSSLLPSSIPSTPEDRLVRDYGQPFVDQLRTLTLNQWQGPIRSGYGQHLVRLNVFIPEHASMLEDVRTAVNRDWENERRIKTSKAFLDVLRQSYDVIDETTSSKALP